MEANKKSRYSVAESFMIMCITRGRDCAPEKCLKCGWLRDEVRESLNRRVLEEMKQVELPLSVLVEPEGFGERDFFAEADNEQDNDEIGEG